MTNESFYPNTSKSDNNILEFVKPYLAKWKIITISMIFFLGLGIYKLRNTAPTYKVDATILVKDERKGGDGLDIPGFEGLGINLSSVKSKLENEIEVLKSRSLMRKVVADLKLNIAYFDNSGNYDKELFNDEPIQINYLGNDSILSNQNASFNVKVISSTKFEITDLFTEKKHIQKFGESFKTSIGKIIIIPNPLLHQNIISTSTKVSFYDTETAVDIFKSGITIEPVNKESSAINLSIKTSNVEKGKAILDKLIKRHQLDAINDKNEVSQNTINFLNERINFISSELSNVEKNVSSFKSDNKIFDLEQNASQFLLRESDNEKIKLENSTQLVLIDYIIDHINSNDKYGLIPANIGITNVSIEKFIESTNNLILQRKNLLETSSEKNPIILNLDNQILSLKNNIRESLNNFKQTLKLKNKEINKESKLLESKLKSAPKQEQDFKEIARQQLIKESLYMFLLQKREETSISLAITVANTKIIDTPYSDGSVVKPKKLNTYIIFLFIGFVIPIIVIYISKLFDTKVHSRKEILENSLPYLGDIPLEKTNKNKVVVDYNTNDSISEAFRILRTNIEFLFNKEKSDNKVIFITSTIEKEGKSFISLNLSNTLGLTNKKIVLVGMDLRAPKILEYINEKNQKGVTNYITDKTISINEIIIEKPQGHKFDLIPSGDIPPNPSELLLNKRVEELFKELRDKYDYILIDTAPVAPVTDTLLISRYSDAIVYVTKANYLEKSLLEIPKSLYNEGKLPNMAVVLNGSVKNNNYGYGYGYGNNLNSKKWYQKLFSLR